VAGVAVATHTCPTGTLFDQGISNCNHAAQVVCPVDEITSGSTGQTSGQNSTMSSSGASGDVQGVEPSESNSIVSTMSPSTTLNDGNSNISIIIVILSA